MFRKVLATIAVSMLFAGTAAPSMAKPPCRDAKGKFIKCPEEKPKVQRCRDAKGKFAKCGTPGAKPVPK